MTGTLIFSLLVNDVGVSAVAGDRVYPVVRPQAEDGVQLIYLLTGTNPSNSNDRPATTEKQNVQVQIFARKYEQVDSLSPKVRNALEAWKDNQESIVFETESDDFDAETVQYVRILDFRVRRVRNFNP